jgi:nucleoside-diphosphate-sugar epimerase
MKVIDKKMPVMVTGGTEEELLRPAKEGTRNILETAKRTKTIKRVLTSSVVAILRSVQCNIRSMSKESMRHPEHQLCQILSA